MKSLQLQPPIYSNIHPNIQQSIQHPPPVHRIISLPPFSDIPQQLPQHHVLSHRNPASLSPPKYPIQLPVVQPLNQTGEFKV